MTATGALDSDVAARDAEGTASDARGEWTSALAWITGAFVLRALLSWFVPLLPDMGT